MDTINEVQNTQNVTPAGGEQSASAADQKQAQKAESRAKLKKAGGKALSVVAETTAVAAQVTVLSFLAGAALTVGAAVGARIAGKYGFPISVAK